MSVYPTYSTYVNCTSKKQSDAAGLMRSGSLKINFCNSMAGLNITLVNFPYGNPEDYTYVVALGPTYGSVRRLDSSTISGSTLSITLNPYVCASSEMVEIWCNDVDGYALLAQFNLSYAGTIYCCDENSSSSSGSSSSSSVDSSSSSLSSSSVSSESSSSSSLSSSSISSSSSSSSSIDSSSSSSSSYDRPFGSGFTTYSDCNGEWTYGGQSGGYPYYQNQAANRILGWAGDFGIYNMVIGNGVDTIYYRRNPVSTDINGTYDLEGGGAEGTIT